MQVKDAIKLAIEKCSNSSTPSLDARVLLCHALSVPYEKLLLKYNDELSKQVEEKFFALILRRSAMEPIAYIVGKQEFYGRDFLVNDNVLIPRPETELLVDEVVADYSKTQECMAKVKVLELGTGSGAIAVTLAKEIPFAQVTAVDICPNALSVARKNARKHKVSKQITFLLSDWYSAVREKSFDYIISNPPYIAHSEQKLVAAQTALFEPKLALYAEGNGLAAYREIISSAAEYLKSNGKIFLEMGYSQQGSISNILHASGFANISVQNDLAGYGRVIGASRNISPYHLSSN